ncbi:MULTISPECIES: Hint domain-containing protein [Roseobacteraceae]|uniref:Leukotoxin n=1 Tax=Pseudosulfitobacter pseudonitzschiae TaxID=1402135 RepID=A0A221K0V6_9RHOB|nr:MULTISPECIES: Hint domain-containing protein [Roseobacteraceae]ASM72543.1 leukotoxin [Pseudosulfitobacter pseudonitzschiae]
MTFYYDPKTPVDPKDTAKTTRDGVVDGDNNANVINAAYTGDPEGDKIDNNDAIIGSDTGDQDIVDARGGDDKVYAGADDDKVYAGAGDDTVYGGAGDDLIYGDSGFTGGTAGKTIGDEGMFRWSELDDPDGHWHGKVDDGENLENMTLTQQVGGVKVSVSTPPRASHHSNGLETEFDNEAVYVGGLKDSINARSSLESEADNGECGTYNIAFDKSVDQVRFNITDIDADVGYVRVLAYGPDGSLIPVDFQVGSGLTLGGNNTITSNNDHGDARTDADAAATVTVTGPVSRIEVIHAGDGHGQSNIYLSDIGIVETFEPIAGTDGEATAAQGAGADFLNGDTGNDTIYGQGGNDTIDGGADDDLLVGGSGDDSIDGGSGNDVIYGDNKGETPPSSTESVRESFEWDQAGVGNGHDLDGFTQNTGNVNVTFKVLQETGAADTEFSTDQQKVHSISDDGKGVDAFSSLDSETKGHGNQADYELSFSEAVEKVSFRVNDIDGDGLVRIKAYDLDGKEINVDMTGGHKLTLIDTDGKFGVDTADSKGGYEEDTSGNYSILVDIPGPVGRITIEHDQNGSNNSGINVTDIYYDVTVGAPAGGDGNDVLNGGSGDDMIFGEGGNDTLTGGEGSDTIYGGEGNDFITSSDPDNDLKVDKGYPGLFTGEEGTAAAENERDFVDGGAGNDTIFTGDDRDTIYGGTGDDVIDAGIDDDEIYGDEGDDRIVGGEGSDIILGGIGNDTIYAGNDPLKVPDLVNIEDDGSNPFGADKRPDNGRDTVYGGEGDDVIYGADDDDLLYGDEGDDYIDGEIDDDTIFGGTGDDTLLGGQGNDEIYGGEGDDYINAGRNADIVYGGAGDDTIYGENGADKLMGGDGDDWIDGGTGDDTLDGGDGDDMIIGATGDDVMTGGAGNDTIDGGNGGDDMMSGGDGRDTFLKANAGDTVDGGTGGDDFDTLDLTGAGKYEYVSRTLDADGDSTSGTIRFLNNDGTSKGTLDFSEIESIIPCFTPGTLIATPKGECRVEDMQVGDRVITRDNGIQEIRWVGQKSMAGAAFERAEHLKPVLIQKGALGGGLPERDMMVSPNHRVLVANDKTALYFEEREVLVAAKHLTGLEGVDIVDVSATTYIHLMFDRHEVILSDGAWTESFQPGDLTLAGIGNAQRNELFELFPELKTREGVDAYTSARRSLKKHEAVLLTK